MYPKASCPNPNTTNPHATHCRRPRMPSVTMRTNTNAAKHGERDAGLGATAKSDRDDGGEPNPLARFTTAQPAMTTANTPAIRKVQRRSFCEARSWAMPAVSSCRASGPIPRGAEARFVALVPELIAASHLALQGQYGWQTYTPNLRQLFRKRISRGLLREGAGLFGLRWGRRMRRPQRSPR